MNRLACHFGMTDRRLDKLHVAFLNSNYFHGNTNANWCIRLGIDGGREFKPVCLGTLIRQRVSFEGGASHFA